MRQSLEDRDPNRLGDRRPLVRVAALCGALGVLFVGCDPHGSAKFDRATWLAWRGRDAEVSPRRRMVNDLRARELTVGRSRASIVALLGAPDFPIGCTATPPAIACDSYALGMNAIDGESLDIRYDASAALVSASWADH
jgi:hypothetical protein